MWLSRDGEDKIHSLRFALLHCINNLDEVHEKGRKARAAAEGFTFEKRVEKYTDIYEDLIKQ